MAEDQPQAENSRDNMLKGKLSASPTTNHSLLLTSATDYGRGGGVGYDLGVGLGLGGTVGVDVGVAVGVCVAVAVAVAVAVGVCVAVAVAVSVAGGGCVTVVGVV